VVEYWLSMQKPLELEKKKKVSYGIQITLTHVEQPSTLPSPSFSVKEVRARKVCKNDNRYK
jgi:hypothetical protein